MRWTIILAFLLWQQWANCQDPFFINYNTDHGLPSSEVYDFEMDAIGNVWFTTDRGVCKFDGYNFTIFTTKDGLSDNTNFEIFRDKDNRLWLNGYSGLISIFDNNRFSPFSKNDSLISHLSQWNNKWIRSITQLHDGSILFCPHPFREGMLQVLDNEGNIKNVQGSTLFLDSNQPLVIDTFSFDNKLLQITKLLTTEAGYKINLGAKKDGNTFLFKNYEVVKINKDLQQTFKTPSIIIKVNTDREGNFWVCTFGGVYFFESGDLTKEPKHYFKNESVTSILQDFEGNYWMSTLESGIYYIPSFQFQKIPLSQSSETDYLTIKSFHNHLITGNSKSELIILDKNLNVVRQEKLTNLNKQIRHIGETNDPNLLTLESGYILEHKDNRLDLYHVPKRNSFYQKLVNEEYIAIDMSGLRVLDRNNYLHPQTKRKFPGRSKKVTQDSKETIWIATLKGLFKIEDYDYENWEEVLFNGNSFGRINDVLVDNNDNVWLATIGKGLFLLLGENIVNIDTDFGLTSNIVNTIHLQNDSTLLIGTNYGVSALHFSIKNQTIDHHFNFHLTQKDGLISNYINDIDVWEDKIVVATNNGICYFNPDQFQFNYPYSPIFINQFSANDSLLSTSDHYDLSHQFKDIFIQYTGISYRKENHPTFYRYRLKKDNTYSEWYYTNDRSVRYNDLQPDDYVFEVSAINNIGQWNENPASISFSIAPYFAQTTWFKSSLWFASLALIIGLFTVQNKRVKRREKERSLMQEAKLRVREAEINALRNQMNPHFIFNSLNSIQNFIFKKDVKKANYYLSKFSSLMRDSLQLTRLEFISAREEINFLKNYIELEQMRFHEKFDFNVKLDDDVDTNSLMIPSLLLQPILENAIKHAFKSITYKGEINLHFFLSHPDQLGITIRDNGSGLSERREEEKKANKKRRSLGIEIIKSRIALLNEGKHLHKASITFIDHTSTLDNQKGLEVRFLLPIVYRNDQNINHRGRN